MAKTLHTPVDVETLTQQVSEHLLNRHQSLLAADDITKTTSVDMGRYVELEKIIISSVKALIHRSDPEIEKAVVANIIGLGIIDPLLDDPDITEIMVNAPDDIWIEKNGLPTKTDLKFKDEDAVNNIIYRIVQNCGRRINFTNPVVNARLPDGSRVHAVLPPCSHTSIINIRRQSSKLFTTKEYINLGFFTEEIALALKYAVMTKCNIVFCGAGTVGKTALQRWASQYIPITERVITIEDTYELKLENFHPHVIALEATENVSIYDLTKNALRMRADRIIIGEALGEELLEFITALLTGHVGFTSIHTHEGKEAAIGRIVSGASRADQADSREELQRMVLDTLDLLVFIKKYPDGSRHLNHITEVQNNNGQPKFNDIFQYYHQESEHKSVGVFSNTLIEHMKDNLPPGEVLPDIPCFGGCAKC